MTPSPAARPTWPTSPSWPPTRPSSGRSRHGATGHPSSAPVADHPTANQTDAPTAGTSVSPSSARPTGARAAGSRPGGSQGRRSSPIRSFASSANRRNPLSRRWCSPPRPVSRSSCGQSPGGIRSTLAGRARGWPSWMSRSSVSCAAAEVRAPGQGWFALFYYASTAASTLLPERRALALIVAAGIVAALTLTLSVDMRERVDPGPVGVDHRGHGLRDVRTAADEREAPRAARQELATLAVAEERNRIARDLHDVLGHSLSLIAIKSELAGRLLPGEPDRARAEIADVEQVAREALASRPRDRRRLSPADARSRARERQGRPRRLGDRCRRSNDSVGPLPPSQDVVLAWAVREAVTNVVRHSARQHGATIRTVAARDPGRARGRRRRPPGRRPDRSDRQRGGTGLQGLPNAWSGQAGASTRAPSRRRLSACMRPSHRRRREANGDDLGAT